VTYDPRRGPPDKWLKEWNERSKARLVAAGIMKPEPDYGEAIPEDIKNFLSRM
jgi:hypothetical protein